MRTVEGLDDHVLARVFGRTVLDRARREGLAQQVRDIEVLEDDERGLELHAAVQGSSRAPYLVNVEIVPDERGGFGIWSMCSCPVGPDCKHAAAVCLLVGRPAAARVPEWQRRLEGVLSELDAAAVEVAGLPAPAPAASADREIALRFDLVLPSRRWSGGSSGPLIAVEPVHQGQRDRWVKTGLTWKDVPRALLAGQHRAEQVQALMSLYAALDVTLTATYSSPPAVPAMLDDFGPSVWRMLQIATAAGVVLVPGKGLRTVSVADEPVEVSLDLATPAGAGAARLSLTVVHAGRVWSTPDVVGVGRREPHGLALLEPQPGMRNLHLVPLERPLPRVLGVLLTEPGVEVPLEDLPRLRADFLPRLGRRVPVSSRDGSVVIPRTSAPRLSLTVRWRPGPAADLQWEWVYDPGPEGAETRFPLGSFEGYAGVRDAAAERALLRLLLGEPDLAPLDVVAGMPVAHQPVSGLSVLTLVDLVDRLADEDLVDLVEVDRPDFREATGEVEVSFEAADPDEGEPANDWLDLEVVVTVEGHRVPLVLILAALTLGHDRIILPGGVHLSTDRPELEALRDLVTAAAELGEVDPEGRRVRVRTHDLGLWEQLAELGVVDAQAAQWVHRARSLWGLTALPDPEPVGVRTALRDYQRDGFRWLAFLWSVQLGGILADDMGLGKTLQVLALISHARRQGAGPFLVVAPTSVVSAWVGQAAIHTPGLRVVAVTGTRARRAESIAALCADADVVVTSYTLVRLDGEEYASPAWGGVILDEAQQAKNHQGKTYQAIRLIEAPFKLAVTGTPFENRLIELWALLSITAPGLYPWPARFLEVVAKPVEKHADAGALRRFRQRIGPFVLRRTKELVAADLPPKQEQVLEVQIGARHRKLYDTHLQKERQRILGLVDDFDRNRVAIFSSLTKLRQLALDPALIDPAHDAVGSAKIDLLVEQLLEVTAEGHRALVFSQFTSFLSRVRDRLDQAGIPCAYLDGSTRRRGEVVDGFRTGTAPVFLISLKAGGVGLTLTEADYVYVLDPWWNPATEAQAVDRAHRIGQDRPVMVYRMVSTGTIEDKVMALKERKAALFAQVIDGEGAAGVGLDADDIRELLAP